MLRLDSGAPPNCPWSQRLQGLECWPQRNNRLVSKSCKYLSVFHKLGYRECHILSLGIEKRHWDQQFSALLNSSGTYSSQPSLFPLWNVLYWDILSFLKIKDGAPISGVKACMLSPGKMEAVETLGRKGLQPGSEESQLRSLFTLVGDAWPL